MDAEPPGNGFLEHSGQRMKKKNCKNGKMKVYLERFTKIIIKCQNVNGLLIFIINQLGI